MSDGVHNLAEERATRRKGLEKPPGGGDSGGMEARVAVLEKIAESTEKVLAEMRADIKDLRKNQEQDFRILAGLTLSTAVGLAALMARGFRWF